MGPEVVLDSAQEFVLRRYWELRRVVPSDRGVPIPDGCDWVLARHLRALDDEYGKSQQEQRENLGKSVSPGGGKYPPPPPAGGPVRRH